MITKKEVQHIAKLARLGLTEKEVVKYQKELSAILNYFEKLKEIDVFLAEPLSHPLASPRDSEARGEERTKFSATLAKNVM